MLTRPTLAATTSAEETLQSTVIKGYVPKLDGLRAVAVLAVMFAHATKLEGFWVGVDLFFVISGLLITSLLMAEIDRSDSIALSTFYRRRMARLYPAVALVAVLTGLIFWVFTLEEWEETLLGTLTSLTYTSSIPRMLGGSIGFLGHTWSLSVEEVFYLVWPPLLLLAHRRGVPMQMFIPVACALSVIWHTVLLFIASEGWMYNAPDARAVQILLGASLVVFLPRVSIGRTTLNLGAAAVTVLLLVQGVTDGFSVLHGRHVPVALGCCILVAWALQDPESGILASPLALWIGKRSYSLYLVHVPLLGMHDDSWPSWARLAARGAAVALSFPLADLLYRKFETPLRERFATPTRLKAADSA
jgi:peptidoglycan/LPS O-acetylase OafA/YrhL